MPQLSTKIKYNTSLVNIQKILGNINKIHNNNTRSIPK